MAYNIELADRLREALFNRTEKSIVEKKMFGGLAFMVDDKMCINVTGDKLMCRIDPKDELELSKREGYEELFMKGKKFNGYCYVHEEGFASDQEFAFWVDHCLAFNDIAKASKKKK